MHARPGPCFVVAALALAGCLGAPDLPLEAGAVDAAGVAPVFPTPIRDAKAVTDLAGGLTVACVSYSTRACFDYPIKLEGPGVVDARLRWSEPGARMTLHLLEGDRIVTDAFIARGAPSTNLSLRWGLDAPGDYTLRVMASVGYRLEVDFGPLPRPEGPPNATAPAGFGPHVILALTDTGVNPYHRAFYRPHLTAHPCTYIRDFSCDIPALNLTVGGDNWKEAVAADEAVWKSIARETIYWIPQTVFVAVRCDRVYESSSAFGSLFGDVCLLDEGDGWWAGHGTGTVSIAVWENPDVLVAFNEGYDPTVFAASGIPVDVVSHSWGSGTPMPYPAAARETLPCRAQRHAPVFVKAAGNDARAVPTDCQTGASHVIAAGGGFPSPPTHHVLSANVVDVESYMMPPWAARDSVANVHAPGSWGGTSFATPTIAGALSKVILEVRRASGYDGGLTADGYVDPRLGIKAGDLRDAMNRTATYTPKARHVWIDPANQIPVNPAAPWLQWGWGFFDGAVAEDAIAHLLKTRVAPEKPAAAKLHMETIHAARSTLYG
ncbi:MAG TPA: S8/S53 family peptidase [Candidatus Thermoplasmatota archaeon]|nr:S8/S53 family peptidase [Candidatus Thermoplasmatota archaeon]